jgi:hypothetical protein
MEGQEHVIAYSSATGSIVYARTYDQEGTGSGCTLMFLSGGKTEEVEVYTPESNAAAKLKELTPTIAERLAGFVAVKGTEWQKDFAVPAFGLTLRWASDSIVAYPSGKKKGVPLAKITAHKPHVPRPTFVYLTADPVLVVEIRYDPGAKYTAGYNAVTGYEIVKLPPELATPAAGSAASSKRGQYLSQPFRCLEQTGCRAGERDPEETLRPLAEAGAGERHHADLLERPPLERR